MAPRYRITLTGEERAALERMTKDGKTPRNVTCTPEPCC